MVQEHDKDGMSVSPAPWEFWDWDAGIPKERYQVCKAAVDGCDEFQGQGYGGATR